MLRKKRYPAGFVKSDYTELEPAVWNDWVWHQYGMWSVMHKRLYDRYAYAMFADSIEIEPLTLYTGNGYLELNKGLRNRTIKPQESCLCQSLMLSILTCPPIPENMIVYRYVSREVLNMIKNPGKEGVFCERGFMSTTLDPSIAQSCDALCGSTELLRIYVPRGTFACYVNLISGRKEWELLFPMGSFLEFVETVDATPQLQAIGVKKVHEVWYSPRLGLLPREFY